MCCRGRGSRGSRGSRGRRTRRGGGRRDWLVRVLIFPVAANVIITYQQGIVITRRDAETSDTAAITFDGATDLGGAGPDDLRPVTALLAGLASLRKSPKCLFFNPTCDQTRRSGWIKVGSSCPKGQVLPNVSTTANRTIIGCSVIIMCPFAFIRVVGSDCLEIVVPNEVRHRYGWHSRSVCIVDSQDIGTLLRSDTIGWLQ